MYQLVNLAQKFSLFSEQWQPKVVAEMNDYQFKVVRIAGDFIWHSHPETDETLMVVEGVLRVDFRDGHVLVKAGEIKQAMDMSLDYFSLFKALFSENYISPLKYAMDKAGVPWGEAKLLPLLEAKDETKAWVDRELTRLGVI